MRLITADLMVRSLKTSAHVWTSVEVDFEHVEQVRQRHREQFKKTEGVSLTYLPFIARAVCDALREFPAVNSSIDIENQTMTLHRYVNLGIAVDLSEQGLLAPVVKNADSLNLRGLARNIAAVAAGGAGPDPVGCGHERLDVHDHQSRPVRQLRLRAGDQPAERGDPVHRRDRAASRSPWAMP